MTTLDECEKIQTKNGKENEIVKFSDMLKSIGEGDRNLKSQSFASERQKEKKNEERIDQGFTTHFSWRAKKISSC
jgi:hypothetical protein